jgi:hypothetical protein
MTFCSFIYEDDAETNDSVRFLCVATLFLFGDKMVETGEVTRAEIFTIPLERIRFALEIIGYISLIYGSLRKTNRIRSLCIVGYNDDIAIAYIGDDIQADFKRIILFSPELFSNIKEASGITEKWRNITRNLHENKEVDEWIKPWLFHMYSSLKIWRPWNIRRIKEILRWKKTRSSLEQSNGTLFLLGVRNWESRLSETPR